ncbi:hypothetical protein HYX14_00370 [Candidatus Woesearchaeota archaeon]|nr:hypothetical protein [Candidatus Woesearchaeota archaeon]
MIRGVINDIPVTEVLDRHDVILVDNNILCSMPSDLDRRLYDANSYLRLARYDTELYGVLQQMDLIQSLLNDRLTIFTTSYIKAEADALNRHLEHCIQYHRQNQRKESALLRQQSSHARNGRGTKFKHHHQEKYQYHLKDSNVEDLVADYQRLTGYLQQTLDVHRQIVDGIQLMNPIEVKFPRMKEHKPSHADASLVSALLEYVTANQDKQATILSRDGDIIKLFIASLWQRSDREELAQRATVHYYEQKTQTATRCTFVQQ